MSLLAQLKIDYKKILMDILTVAVAVQAVLLAVTGLAPTLHIPGSTQAIITTLSTVVSGIIVEVRRISAQNAGRSL